MYRWKGRQSCKHKYFELKSSPPCMFNSADSWGCSIAGGLKDTSRCHRLLGLQEFQVSRSPSHPVKAPLPNCENALLELSNLDNIMNEDVHVTLSLEEECAG